MGTTAASATLPVRQPFRSQPWLASEPHLLTPTSGCARAGAGPHSQLYVDPIDTAAEVSAAPCALDNPPEVYGRARPGQRIHNARNPVFQCLSKDCCRTDVVRSE